MKQTKIEFFKIDEHKFQEDDIVQLKADQDLDKVKVMVKRDILGEAEGTLYVSWLLTLVKENILKNNPLIIESCIIWHIGVPFYMVSFNNEFYYIGEFYLRLFINEKLEIK